MTDAEFMRAALEAARRGMAEGQTPFGAALERGGELIASGHNEVWARTDPTAHAEMVVIRKACLQLGTIDLSGATIYSTCEPCPMCFAAIHWARIDRVVFGARIADAQAAGFNELTISNEMMKSAGASPVQIVQGGAIEECVELLKSWGRRGDRRTY